MNIRDYIIVINIISFFLFGIDKYNAIKKRQRISENTLFLVSILFGSLGSVLGMIIFHHKTKKKKFYIIYILLLIEILILVKGVL